MTQDYIKKTTIGFVISLSDGRKIYLVNCVFIHIYVLLIQILDLICLFPPYKTLPLELFIFISDTNHDGTGGRASPEGISQSSLVLSKWQHTELMRIVLIFQMITTSILHF